MRRKHHIDEEAEINITPMLDIVFIMLIFFIVTTSFVKEKGLEVSRPASSPPKEVQQDKGPIVVRIESSGLISLKGRILEPRAVIANLEAHFAADRRRPPGGRYGGAGHGPGCRSRGGHRIGQRGNRYEVVSCSSDKVSFSISRPLTAVTSIAAARALGIAVCNIRNYCSEAVAQHVMTLTPSFPRQKNGG
jgi:biopolymer transport protein ExbD